eukprot:Plantae.Rhodophyta-Purpureofilum_apyrenoidigerum.ctg6669.p1 GENE.Plantae.Rhodophyta-Purpureofilum_apyrenoidigerum.ctg6669~~Plantae.Rhodophyta-Purpureofilum_apyrenoidigerum.ctg6669.p1  ORF type:complete len:224 (+),score=26.06 Plantae.Rhodophyta-Purpureofilum_apyrenoidigerum.ctg6669:262-933(+)
MDAFVPILAITKRRRHVPVCYTAPPSKGGRDYGSGALPRGSKLSEEKDGAIVSSSDGEPLLHVVFFRPQIHWNTGNIGRTCIGIGGAKLHLIGPIAFSLEDKQVRRAGLDYWHAVNLTLWDSWDHFETEGPCRPGTDAEAYFFTKYGAQSLLDVKFPSDGKTKIVLIFGNETDGLVEIEDKLQDRKKIALPMHNQDVLRSYNLSTSASIALWEAYRQLALSAL